MSDNENEYLYHERIAAHTVRANDFEIADQKEVVRSTLFTAEDGTPVLNLLNPQQESRFEMSIDDNGQGYISLFNRNAKRQVDLLMSKEGYPFVRLYDATDEVSVALYIDEDRPALVLYDTNG